MKKEKKKLTIDDVKVWLKVLNKPSIIASVQIKYGDLVTKGWRILRSQYKNRQGYYLWFRPPESSSFKTLAFFEDKKLYRQIEDKVFEAFRKITKGDYQDWAEENILKMADYEHLDKVLKKEK